MHERNVFLTVGIGGLCGLVLAYAFNGHRLRRHYTNQNKIEVAHVTRKAQAVIR